MTSERRSFDGSESTFSLVEASRYGNDSAILSDAGRASKLGRNYGMGSNGQSNSYKIAAILANPNAGSAVATISTNLSNLNPLRSTSGPKTGATRGKPAASIVLSDIPKVSQKDFQPYIESIRSDWEDWSRTKLPVSETPILNDDDNESDSDHPTEEHVRRRRAIIRALEGSTFASSLSGKGKRRKVELPPLDIIPDLFLQENFNLANPQTFDAIRALPPNHSSEHTSTSMTASKSYDTMDQVLQEKLSYYLDIVELHLGVEIAMKSASFFSALSNLQALNAQSQAALQRISSLKLSLADIDDHVARKGLEVNRGSVRRRRLKRLDEAVGRVMDVLHAIDHAEDLAEAGETREAMDLIEALDDEWASRSPLCDSLRAAPLLQPAGTAVSGLPSNAPRTPLHGLFRRPPEETPVKISRVAVLANLPRRISSVRDLVASAVQTELVGLLIHQLQIQVHQSRDTALEPVSLDKSDSSIADFDNTLQGKLLDLLTLLLRCGERCTAQAFALYKMAYLKEVRLILNNLLPPGDAEEIADIDTSSPRASIDVEDPSSNPASSDLAGMDHRQYMSLMHLVYPAVLLCIKVAALHSRILLSLISAPVPPGDGSSSIKDIEPDSSSIDDARFGDLGTVVPAVADYANARLARVVGSRNEKIESLQLKQFLEAYDLNWQFLLDCEVLSRKMVVGLRAVILSQTKHYLQYFHISRLTQVARDVEEEKWTTADVPADVQRAVDLILSSAVADPVTLLLRKQDVQSPANVTISAGSRKLLSIEDRTFYTVSSSLVLVQSLLDYLKIVLNLPTIATDIMSRIVELLKQYNSRVCQVVLGAGAMRSAGLKNITAKHLALASQALSVVISLIPYIRECLRRHLRAKQAIILVDFDRVKRDYQEHQNEIHAKLVAIMGDRLAVHAESLQKLPWDQPAGDDPNSYMETLVKETSTLHKVLLRFLPGAALELVMMQVLSAINSRLAEEYSRIEVKTDIAKERMLIDARYMKAKFAELKGLERPAPGAELEDLIRMKRVSAPQPAPPMKAFSTPALTQARASLSRGRTSSLSSVRREEEEQPPALPDKPVTPIAEAPQQLELVPKNIVDPGKTASSEGATVRNVLDLASASLLPEQIPLPPSPTIVAMDVADVESSHSERLNEPFAVGMPAKNALDGEREQSVSVGTNIQDPSVISAIAQVKLADETLPPVASPQSSAHIFPATASTERSEASSPPTGANVKNRLASLFSKRSTATIPAINVTLPKLPQVLSLGGLGNRSNSSETAGEPILGAGLSSGATPSISTDAAADASTESNVESAQKSAGHLAFMPKLTVPADDTSHGDHSPQTATSHIVRATDVNESTAGGPAEEIQADISSSIQIPSMAAVETKDNDKRDTSSAE